MQSTVLMPCSQEVSTGPYPVPHDSRTYPHILLFEIKFDTNLPSASWSLK